MYSVRAASFWKQGFSRYSKHIKVCYFQRSKLVLLLNASECSENVTEKMYMLNVQPTFYVVISQLTAATPNIRSGAVLASCSCYSGEPTVPLRLNGLRSVKASLQRMVLSNTLQNQHQGFMGFGVFYLKEFTRNEQRNIYQFQ